MQIVDIRNPVLRSHFEQLTLVQRSAAAWDDGSLLVLAGPGSGKTRVLTCRIAFVLERYAQKKFRVLALTFTNRAADEMRTRVQTMVPDLSRRLFIGTFHSFAADVLRQHGMHLGVQPDFRIYGSDKDLESIMAGAVTRASRANTLVKSIDVGLLPVIRRLRSELITPDNAYGHVSDESLRERIGDVYRGYEEELRANNALDFESLIYYTCRLFQQYPAFGERYRNIYHYWCIDEFQDTNSAQYALLKLMAGKNFSRLFVVADDDQVIYQWNGASHKRLEEFRDDFLPQVIQLPTNYRCPPEIVTIANRLIRHNLLRTVDKKPLESGLSPSDGGDTVRTMTFADEHQEAEGIATDIAHRHTDDYSAVAVLARTKRLLEHVQRELQKLGVPVHLAEKRTEFQSTPYIWLHASLRQAINRRDVRNFEVVAGAFAELTGIETNVEELITRAEAKQTDYLREWCEFVIGTRPLPIVETLRTSLVQSLEYKRFCRAAVEWFKTTFEARYQAEEVFSGYSEDRRAWGELFSEILNTLGENAPLEAFLHELALRSKEPSVHEPSVSLLTIHAAKGKEFDHVYLIGIAEDVLPSYQGSKKGPHSTELEEERRNCFVAITRARKSLTLSFARTYFGWSKAPSRFLREMELSPV